MKVKLTLKIRVSITAVAALAAVATIGTPAYAADNNTFGVVVNTVIPQCTEAGLGMFIDYGEGDPSNPANNDDYIEIWDSCVDGYSIAVWAWESGTYLGGRVNANGGGTRVIWDPFGNVEAGHTVGIKACRWHGGAVFENSCNSFTKTITDG